MLYAGSDGVDVRPLADQWAGLGGEGGRWFASKLTPSDFRTGNSAAASRERFEGIVQIFRERGLRGDATLLCDTASWTADDGGFVAHVETQARQARDHGDVMDMLVIANELGHKSQRNFGHSEVQAFLQHARGFWSGPLSAGAWVDGDELDANGNYWPADFPESNVISTHFQRTGDPAWDMASHGFSEMRNIWNRYPWQGRLSNEPEASEKTGPPGVFAALLGIDGTCFNTWSTLHCSQGRDCEPLSGQQLEDARLFLRFGKLLPRHRYHFENANNTGGWAGSPIKSAAFVEGPSSNPNEKNVWRAHSFKDESTGQWYLVLSGPDVTRPFLEFQNGFSLGEKIDAFGQHVEVWTMKQG